MRGYFWILMMTVNLIIPAHISYAESLLHVSLILISLLNVTNLDVLCIILLSIVDLRVVRAKLYCSRKLIASNHLQMKLQI